MAISDETLCMFHARIETNDGIDRIEVPEHEVRLGNLHPGQTYRVALFPAVDKQTDRSRPPQRSGGADQAPVSEEERVNVEIEDIGEQGDGLTRIGKGYIVFVPGTEIGDRVTVEIGKVTENFAFGEVVEGPH